MCPLVLTPEQIAVLYAASLKVVAENNNIQLENEIPLLAVVFARAIEHSVSSRYMSPVRHDRLNQIIKQALDLIEHPKE